MRFVRFNTFMCIFGNRCRASDWCCQEIKFYLVMVNKNIMLKLNVDYE